MLKNALHRTWILVLLSMTSIVMAQKNPDLVKYYMEAGLTGGGAFYLGDVNEVPFTRIGPSIGGFCKYKFTGHHELGLEINGGWAGIEKTDAGMQKTDFVDISAVYTFNFWNYGVRQYEENASIVTPYVFAGFGVTAYDLAHTHLTANIPFGLGVKVKLGKRWNVGVSWTMHRLMADNFDNVDDPYGLNRGLFLNRDWLSTFGAYVSCDFLEVCAPCRKIERLKSNKAKRQQKSNWNRSKHK